MRKMSFNKKKSEYMEEVIDFVSGLEIYGFLKVEKGQCNIFDLSRMRDAERMADLDDNSFQQEFEDMLSSEYDLFVSYMSTDMDSILLFNMNDMCDNPDCEDDYRDHVIGDCE